MCVDHSLFYITFVLGNTLGKLKQVHIIIQKKVASDLMVSGWSLTLKLNQLIFLIISDDILHILPGYGTQVMIHGVATPTISDRILLNVLSCFWSPSNMLQPP